ncbi:MAG: ATP-binding protein [Bacilli bacterium]|nr:ATP-binding protein [Bacilli bacterium]
MFGKIVYISDSVAHIAIPDGTPVNMDLMNLHVVFEDGERRVLGEVEDVSEKEIKVHFLGVIEDGKFVGGVLRKPTLEANIRMVTEEELNLITGLESEGMFKLGVSPLYNDKPIYVDINEICSNHLAIFGNTGSGKSYGVASFIQSLFYSEKFSPYRANYMIFDAYGEYHNAFERLSEVNPNYQFKYYTTNKNDKNGELLSIPLWLLDIDDFALLLQAEKHSQLQIIEKMIKLARIISLDSEDAIKYKNHLIAKAILDTLYTNQTAASKRNDIFTIMAGCQTEQFNLEAPVQGIGYVRKLRECFTIDRSGEFTESVLITQYITSFIDDSLDNYEAPNDHAFNLDILQKALDFTLISDGFLRNEKLYDEAITLKVRLHSIAISENGVFFNYPNYVDLNGYIASLVAKNNRKSQIINFNLEDTDDRLSKTIVKIYSKMLFTFTKHLQNRGAIPFHILLEESHRYVQSDSDNFLLGYNIFERIAKEGRKFGLILNLVSQRPVELSETVISQISNFLIFKMTHPRDLEYIKKMLPNMSAEIMEKQKSLQPGMCVAFGRAFKVPMIIKMPLPNPAPHSSNVNVVSVWQGR